MLPGNISGEALVTRKGFNSLASFYKSMVSGSKFAICSDQDNLDLYGKNLTDMIICLPKTIGSSSAGATWDTVASMGIAPKAMLFAEPIDSLAAAGLVLGLTGQRPGEDTVQAVMQEVPLHLQPQGDFRGSPEYRRRMADVLLRRALQAAIDRL